MDTTMIVLKHTKSNGSMDKIKYPAKWPNPIIGLDEDIEMYEINELEKPVINEVQYSLQENIELTNDQRKILDSARKYGYYDYPRKITSEELSEKIGLNKDFALENLRKAEKRIFTRILKEN